MVASSFPTEANTMKRVLGIAITIAGFALIAACTMKGGPVKVESVEPSQGTTAGGDEISIVGGGFQPGKTQAEVKFGPVDVQVMFDDGATFKIANGFRYVEPSAGESARRAFFGGQQQGGAKDKIEVEKK